MKKETHLAIQWTTLIIAAIGTGIALYKVFSDETSQYNYWLFILLFVLIGLRSLFRIIAFSRKNERKSQQRKR